MPRYDFKCDVDGEVREETMPASMRDDVVMVCSQGHLMRRMIPAIGFQFKGKFSPEYWGYNEKRSDGLTPLAE